MDLRTSNYNRTLIVHDGTPAPRWSQGGAPWSPWGTPPLLWNLEHPRGGAQGSGGREGHYLV